MNKFLLIITFLLFSCFASAQHGGGRFTSGRFQAEMEQYITQNAGLTPTEAEVFFPVYSEMLKKQRTLHDKMKNLKRIKPATDAECRNNIRQCDELELEMKKLQKIYHEKFMKILSPSKVFDILKAEDRFHRQAFRKAACGNRNK